jgi:hypothetical protein
MAVIVTTPINGRTDDLNELSFPAPKGELNRLRAAPPAPEQRILAVEFRSPEGRLVRDRRRRDGRGGDRLGKRKLPGRRDLAPGRVERSVWRLASETRPAARGGPPISGTR